MRNYLVIILVIITLSCGFGYLYAQEERTAKEENAPFIYESKGKRDPFVPLIDREGRLIIPHGVINSINDVVLEGILYDPRGDSVVAFNGLVLKENEKAGSIKVKRIEADKVILLFEDEEYTLKLKE